MRATRRVMIALALALGLSVGLPATSASAAGTTHVYVSLPTWLGNCPNGGSVKYLQVSTWAPSTSDSRADSGDDLVYIRAGYRENTTVVARGLCYKGSTTYWGPAVSRTIYATRSGQTWWIGPAGVRSN